jgi:hypothetical protein
MLTKMSLAVMALLPCLATALRGSGGERSLTSRNMAFRSLADFEWEIDPVVDYPVILGFNETNEIGFKYNFTGDLSAEKYLKFDIYNKYCNVSITDDSIKIPVAGYDMVLAGNNVGSNGEAAYYFPLDIDQSVISTTEYFELAADGLNATIEFCVKGEYIFGSASPESINFHETIVTITVNLTAGFKLEDIVTDRTAATKSNKEAELGCDVTPFYCDETTFVEVPPPAAYVQGDALIFCVEVAAADQERCHIVDVLEADLDQDNLAPVVDQHTDLVTAAIGVGLSIKDCNPAIAVCRIKTQLTSKFFGELAPSALDITGVARLGFGPREAGY